MANVPIERRNTFPGDRQDPLRALARFQRDMDRMFDDFWSNDWEYHQPDYYRAAWQPGYHVEDKDSHFLLKFEVPGYSRDDIKIEVLDNQMHLHGEKKDEKNDKEAKSFERSYGSFDRWFTLPPGLKAEEVEARVEHGVLEVALPKHEASKAKEIKIGDGRSGIFGKLLGKKDSAA
jgi:HSP20 family protein